MAYTVSEDCKKLYAGIYLLEYLTNQQKDGIDVFLSKDDEDLEPVLEWLMARSLVEIDSEKYKVSSKGRELLEKFMKRYSEYLNIYDVFSAVDLGTGEFAFSYYFEFDHDQDWQNYLKEERWEDLRIAVAEFKKMDPVELVFMSFINEKRFGRDKTGWQFDLLLGSVWDEILDICNSAVKIDQLAWEDEEGFVSGESVISDVISQGVQLIQDLHKEEESLLTSVGENDEEGFGYNDDDEYETVTVTTYHYHDYDPYYDPYYISPLWLVPLILL